jgi:hypothetical protein
MDVELSLEPGWIGAFTRQQAQGTHVIPNGVRIVKASAETGVPRGTLGTVLGSMWFDTARQTARLDGGDRLLYFVEWDILPRKAVSVHDFRIKRADT